MKIYINGIGVISACGPGFGDFSSALMAGGAAPGRPEGFSVDMKRVAPGELKNLRRADKLSKLSVLAAREALTDSGHAGASLTGADHGSDGVDAGIILTTALGPHTTTFRFLDDIIKYGDASVSPTIFSNSVHNAAASYIATDCGLRGPTLTVTQFFHSFHEGLALAMCWLREGRVPSVLVGAVDVLGDVLGYVASRMLTPSPDGVLKSFELGQSGHVPGEGAAFFLLESERRESSYCCLGAVETGHNVRPEGGGDGSLLLIDADGMAKNETLYDGDVPAGGRVASYSPLFGSMMTGSAMHMAAGALMFREGRVFASPVAGDNPHNLPLAQAGPMAGGACIEALRISCAGRRGIVRLCAL